jgi:hypothetical protein
MSMAESNAPLQELHDTVLRVSSYPGVQVVQIWNAAGDLLAESRPSPHTTGAQKLLQLAQFHVQLQNADDELVWLQVRSKKGQELTIAPHGGFALVVVKQY